MYMLRSRLARALGVASSCTFAATSAATAADAAPTTLPPISAAGIHKALGPPRIAGKENLVLLQVQTAFRHGARTPVNDDGCASDGLCTWHAHETNKPEAASLRLFTPGSKEPIDPAVEFKTSGGAMFTGSDTLIGGGRPGGLTQVGLQQAFDLGKELRVRYVDPNARLSEQVRPSYLLPSSWDASSRMVAPRSTRVERTVYTLSGVLGGIFPELCSVGASRPFVDVALNCQHPSDEFMVLNTERCPRLSALFNQGLRLSTIGLTREQKQVIDEVETGSSWDCPVPEWKLISYRDWYACRRAADKQVPPIFHTSLAPRLDTATAKQMHHIFCGVLLAFEPKRPHPSFPLLFTDPPNDACVCAGPLVHPREETSPKIQRGRRRRPFACRSGACGRISSTLLTARMDAYIFTRGTTGQSRPS